MSYTVGNVDSSKPLDLPGKEYSDSGSQHGPAPPLKRPRNKYDHTSNSADFIPMNPRIPRTSQSQQNPRLNKGTGNIFYKTQLCAKFVRGNCSNGEKCTYAHGLEELHEPPPNWKEHVHDNGKKAKDKGQRTNRGVNICRDFIFGKGCPFGGKCNFLHRIPNNTETARPLPMNVPARSIESTGPMLEQRNDTGKTRLNKHLTNSDALLVNKKPACLKTKMCTKWESTGQCPYKGNCHYAHGQSELQVPGSHIETEMITDVHSFPKKALPQLVNDALPTIAEVPTQERVNSGVLPKRKMRREEISIIYGDWPEELIPHLI